MRRRVEAQALVPGDVIAFARRVVIETHVSADGRVVVGAGRLGSDEIEWVYRWARSTPIFIESAARLR